MLRYSLPHSSLAANFVALRCRSAPNCQAMDYPDLFGASIRMGALIPLYSLENPSFLMIFLKQSIIPLYPSSPTTGPVCNCLEDLQQNKPFNVVARNVHSRLHDIQWIPIWDDQYGVACTVFISPYMTRIWPEFVSLTISDYGS